MVREEYKVSFNEPHEGHLMMGMTLLPLAEVGMEASVIVHECKDPAVSRGITAGSKVLAINGKPADGLTMEEVKALWLSAEWPRTLEFYGSRPIESSTIITAKSRVGQ
jgi:hypothetical protein